MTAPSPANRRPPRRVTPDYLERAALHYLERFASSSENLRRVLMRKVDRSVQAHGTDREQAAGWVEALVERYRGAGLLNDDSYARMRAESLHRRGASTRAIREKLAAKGVDRDTADAALGGLREDVEGDLDLAAAMALAKRRRLGSFRSAETRAAHREKDLAALGRAGFAYEIARRVVDAEDINLLDP
ncbi:RecX family transcriptional regulator [Azospirillum sp. RWY-5-1]|uniref:Regulatory protein RecX n=1 Tax=Azospirillum oleiclasticum TaxID=2735135 RepID=A0ABX2TGW8_9PROT|nr:RecX family transcriptional regulator [Azospirillum oleiclasticum]NYZ16031.1 RecX family transcriptional regulator [Azospirillum oleiclasticum]NYZ23491.1 RecX family transcriptional regulator [Azospirillum oleiclasticum]